MPGPCSRQYRRHSSSAPPRPAARPPFRHMPDPACIRLWVVGNGQGREAPRGQKRKAPVFPPGPSDTGRLHVWETMGPEDPAFRQSPELDRPKPKSCSIQKRITGLKELACERAHPMHRTIWCRAGPVAARNAQTRHAGAAWPYQLAAATLCFRWMSRLREGRGRIASLWTTRETRICRRILHLALAIVVVQGQGSTTS